DWCRIRTSSSCSRSATRTSKVTCRSASAIGTTTPVVTATTTAHVDLARTLRPRSTRSAAAALLAEELDERGSDRLRPLDRRQVPGFGYEHEPRSGHGRGYFVRTLGRRELVALADEH